MDTSKIKFYYQCERCEYKTKLLTDMTKHLEKKNICVCKKNIIMSDEEFKQKSLERKYENYDEIIAEYNSFKTKENEEKEKDSSIYWKDIHKRCDFCFNTFFKKGNLEKHKKTCKIKEILDKNKKDKNTNIINNNNVTNNIINNITHNNITNNITNITVKFDDKSINKWLIPFWEKFDTSHISDQTKLDLLLSTLYEDTLKEILKNNSNLNFLIDNTFDNKSYVYIGDKKLERIDNEEIYNKIWLEVKNYLIESLNEIKIEKQRYEKNIINFIESKIKEKHLYLTCSNNQTVNNVKSIIQNISKENEEKTINNFKLISQDLIENNI